MDNKINLAIQYVNRFGASIDPVGVKNDAANIYADSYDEYLAIWEALNKI